MKAKLFWLGMLTLIVLNFSSCVVVSPPHGGYYRGHHGMYHGHHGGGGYGHHGHYRR